jgi:hypothetical protein
VFLDQEIVWTVQQLDLEQEKKGPSLGFDVDYKCMAGAKKKSSRPEEERIENWSA